MISDDLALTLNSFEKSILPSVEAECPRPIFKTAEIHRDNLASILERLREYERSTAPLLPAPTVGNVIALRRRPRVVSVPPTDGGDAA
jgi:hypothetical protein